MDLIPLADPVRIKTKPHDDPSAEAGMAGALAAFLSVLGGDADGTPAPDGSLRPAAARIDANVSATPAPFFDGTEPPTEGQQGASGGPTPVAAVPVAEVMPAPAVPRATDGASDARRAATATDISPPSAESAAILPARDGAAGERQASGMEPRGAAAEARPAATSDAAPAQAAMPRAEAPDPRRPAAQGGEAGRPAEATAAGSGEQVATGYTVSRAEPVKGASVPPRDSGARGAGIPMPAPADGPQGPAGSSASAAPGLRPVAVPATSAAPESVAAMQRPFVTAEASGADDADRQLPPASPQGQPAGTMAVGGKTVRPLPVAIAAAGAASRAADGAIPVRASRVDAAAPPADQTRAASPTVAAPSGEAQIADGVAPPPTATDAEPAEMPGEPGDPIVATTDSAPLSRGVDRVAGGPPPTGALPAGLGHRLAEAVSQFPDRPVEITLSPEELGRVRLTLATHDGALTMMVQADRPETLDLLRRNIDSLAQDFRDLGYQDLTFSFGQDRAPRQPPGADTLASAGETNASPSPVLAEDPGRDRIRRAADGGGLDLRL